MMQVCKAQVPPLASCIDGTPWDQGMLLKRKFKPLLHALGIKLPHGDGFYILRHGNATLMSSFGAPQNLRQQRLGHAAGSPVTESVYTHVISDDGKCVGAAWRRGMGSFGRQLDLKEKRLRSGVS
jgi:hypothetical protein